MGAVCGVAVGVGVVICEGGPAVRDSGGTTEEDADGRDVVVVVLL